MPKFWRVSWQGGFLDFSSRARARGFAMIQRAHGVECEVAAHH
mgnify:CR=1 FL=1